MIRIHRTTLPLLSDKQFGALRDFLASTTTFMPHALSSSSGLSQDDALKVTYALHERRAITLWIMLYDRKCERDPDVAFTKVKFDDPLPSLPLECLECDRTIESRDDLAFGLQAELNDDIGLVESLSA